MPNQPSRRGRTIAAVATIVAIAALPSSAQAGAPCQEAANDAFAAPQLLTGTSATAAGSNCVANKEAGEPNHAGDPGGRSVWYQWTPTADGPATVSLKGSTFDTLLGVYTGSTVGALAEVAANDDEAPGLIVTSKVTFQAATGTTYRIAVDGRDDVLGAIALALTQVPVGQPEPPIDQAACDKANAAVDAAQRKLKKAKEKLKKAKERGHADRVKKAKARVRKARKGLATAREAAAEACGTAGKAAWR